MSTLNRLPLLRRLPLFALIWTGVGLVFVAQYAVFAFTDTRPDARGFEVDRALWRFASVLLWILLTPLIVWLSDRYPIERGPGLGRRIALHAGFAFALTLVEAFVYTGLHALIDGHLRGMDFEAGRYFRGSFLGGIVYDTTIYALIAALVHARRFDDAARSRAVHLARLEQQLTQSQLQALRMQLNPHFLFNTLQTISAIMETNVAGARRLMVELSDLLRRSLDSGRTPLVPLREEVDFLRRYLAIEAERMGPRLRVALDVAPEAEGALVPPLLLQPLAENAIRHGISSFAAGGTVGVEARVEGDALVVVVSDSGPGFRADAPAPASGIGLSATRERLVHLYGDDATLTTETIRTADGAPAGARVRVTLPCYTDVLDAIADDTVEAADDDVDDIDDAVLAEGDGARRAVPL